MTSQVKLAEAYFKGQGTPQDDTTAAIWYRKAAEAGNPEAQNMLGFLYRMGLGVEKNKATAVEWYRKAAMGQNITAMYNLGAAYYNGDGTQEINDITAYAWFLLAQERGSKEATDAVQHSESALRPDAIEAGRLAVARMFVKGQDQPKDHARAAFWYRRAADQGSLTASVDLAQLLLAGQGIAPEYHEARQRCEWAASKKFPPGHRCLGLIYRSGLGVTNNPAEALKHFESAANKGDAPSMLILGEMYRNEPGIKQDRVKAYSWMLRAYSLGIVQAKQTAASLESEMSSKELCKALREAHRNCANLHPMASK